MGIFMRALPIYGIFMHALPIYGIFMHASPIYGIFMRALPTYGYFHACFTHIWVFFMHAPLSTDVPVLLLKF